MISQKFWEPTFYDYYFSFDGRIGRFEFFIYGILLNLFGGIVTFAFTGIGFLMMEESAIIFGYTAGMLAILWSSIALGIKRCHDRNRSGLFILIAFIPVINLWFLFEMLFLKGVEDDNKYGLPSFESTCKITETSCPICATDYTFWDKATRPLMCKTCWKSQKAKQNKS